MDEMQTTLLETIRNNRLFTLIMENPRQNDQLSSELVVLHNKGTIDIVKIFNNLGNDSPPRFFRIRHVFEKALPKLDAPVSDIMECVQHLFQESGQDGVSGLIFLAYIDFCTASPSRPEEALSLIKNSPAKFPDLLLPSLVAGFHANLEFFINEAIALTKDKTADIRKSAITSLGRIEPKEQSPLPEKALTALEQANDTETDDSIFYNLMISAFHLYQKDIRLENRMIRFIASVLSQESMNALLAASQLFS